MVQGPCGLTDYSESDGEDGLALSEDQVESKIDKYRMTVGSVLGYLFFCNYFFL